MSIGAYPTWSVSAARTRAAELRREVDRGFDPLARKIESQAEPSLGDLWRWYESGDLRRKAASTQRNVTAIFRNKILPGLGPHLKLSSLQRRDVQSLVDHVTHRHGPTIANRVHSHLRRALNLAVADGMLMTNVATLAIARNAEEARQRYLTKQEFIALRDALVRHANRKSAAAVMMLVLTGARKSEVLGMRWSEIDFESGRWTRAPWRTKQRRHLTTPISREALTLLNKMYGERDETSQYVFPGNKSSRHLTDIKKFWASVCATANVVDCRIHDLRHSFASVVASSGGSLEIVGALLGHSQLQTTRRYAHLFDETLREATEHVASAFGETGAINCTGARVDDLPALRSSRREPNS